MAKPILMPQVGQDLETAIIGEWLVEEGDFVEKGDIIATVESEKAAFDVEAFEAGYILKLLFEVGDEARVLKPIAFIGEKDEKLESEATKTPAAESPQKPAKSEEKSPESSAASTERIFASPSARRLAREHGIDLQQVTPKTAPPRITKQDIEGYLAEQDSVSVETKPVSPAEADQVRPFSKMRRVIAERLVQSKQTIPHFYLFLDVDISTVVAWRADFNQESAEKISLNDVIVWATARALLQFPQLNGHVNAEEFIQRKDIHIGVAVSIEAGLLVPVISHTDQLTLPEISRISKKNIESARRGSLNTSVKGSFTISNLGMHAINAVLPIINPPECAILGVGKIEKRVVPVGDSTIGIRDYLTLTLACDHRVIDGSDAAKFLNEIKTNLENFQIPEITEKK